MVFYACSLVATVFRYGDLVGPLVSAAVRKNDVERTNVK